MNDPGAERRSPEPAIARAVALTRNARLLAQAAIQHAVDDPALLALQVSRRLPVSMRTALGRQLERASSILPGLGALGSLMSGRRDMAEKALEEHQRPLSRLGAEVAVVLDRPDLLPARAAAPTRAREAWSRGALHEALGILEEDGRGSGRQARRLRSEIALLTAERRIGTPARPIRPLPGTRTESSDPHGLRVLHVLTNSLPHTQSGYSLRSHRILTALREAGIESVALTRTGYPVMVGLPLARDEDTIDGIRYVRTLPASLPETQEQRVESEVERALELVAEFRPHVIHATTNYLNAHVARTVAELTGLPWVFEVRGLMEQTWIASHTTAESRQVAAGSEKARLIAACEGDLAQRADAVVTLSSTMARELVARGVPPETITLVPNGVDESLLDEDLSPTAAREIAGLDLPAGSFLVGAVSALVDYEGFDVLLRAVARIVHDPGSGELATRLHVLLAGDGASAPRLRSLAAGLRIEDRVIMPGRVPHEQAATWVQCLDVVVVPRLDREVSRSVTPQKPVEAGALARPVILSDLPALRETITDDAGDLCGLTFPAGDDSSLASAIIELAKAPGELSRLAVRARAMARQRTWSTMMRRYRGMYTTVTGRRQEESARGE